MRNYLQKAEEFLKEDEKVIQRLLVPRHFLLKGTSTIVILTDKRIIYNKIEFNFKFINLSNIINIAYQPMALHSGGIVKVITSEGKNITITPSFVGQQEAMDFINKVKKLVKIE